MAMKWPKNASRRHLSYSIHYPPYPVLQAGKKFESWFRCILMLQVVVVARDIKKDRSFNGQW